ncbi:DUF6069 family protein [Lacisediminihabitans sp. FW035]
MIEQSPSTRTVLVRSAIAIVIALTLNAIVAIALSTLVSAPSSFLALTPGPVVFLTALGMIAGTVVYLIVKRLSSRPNLWFAWIASAVALLSLGLPIALAIDPSAAPERLGEATAAAALALIPLHLIPAASLIAALLARPGRRAIESKERL